MPLTDKAIKAARPGSKPLRLFDGGGLYLELSPKGSKWWRLKYRYAGKEKRISLGVYGPVTLKEARERRDEAKRLLGSGVDPSEERIASKVTLSERAESGLESVAREWFVAVSKKWAPGHADKVIHRPEHNVFPYLGKRSIAKISSRDVLGVLRKVEA